MAKPQKKQEKEIKVVKNRASVFVLNKEIKRLRGIMTKQEFKAHIECDREFQERDQKYFVMNYDVKEQK